MKRGDAPDTGEAPVDGRRARWADHRTARRAELIDATIAAVQEFGATVGMDQIAAVAHTSKPVIYRHFSDKADLYRAVGGKVADELVLDIATATQDITDPRERTARGIDAFFQVLERRPEVYKFVVGYPILEGNLGGKVVERPRGEDLVADYIARVEELITRLLMDQPVELALADARLWGSCIVGMVRAAGDWWLAERAAYADGTADPARSGTKPLTRAQLTEQVTVLAWSGVVGAVVGPKPAVAATSSSGRSSRPRASQRRPNR